MERKDVISRSLGTSRQHNGGPDQRVYAKCAVCHSSNSFHPNVAFPKSRPLCLPFQLFFFFNLSRGGRVVRNRTMASKGTSKSFKGCTLFRHRIVTATLSGKPIRISDIRSNTVSHASYIRSVNTAYPYIHYLVKRKGGRQRSMSQKLAINSIPMFSIGPHYYSTRNTPPYITFSLFVTQAFPSCFICDRQYGCVCIQDAPGLRDFEASFLRLLDKITNGCQIEINDTGTKLRYKPGMIIGGSELEHDCGKSRGIGWFLEGLLMLA